ncbi:hypothetical protein KMZ93_21065 [Bradyrhizobium sediminis]|uniref:Secreted protein n=1 Tax=Bradyrhizobium sediminis TaxID=2840469 RepID=A0A975RWT5_9BRAD|nr:hypothetical protein [Bradyrhizobium sediminis]QWG22438.1 hypothetical protein KMZ93_21065 [Bradyrhizobium sediminis]
MAVRISLIPRRKAASVGHFLPLSSLIFSVAAWACGSAATTPVGANARPSAISPGINNLVVNMSRILLDRLRSVNGFPDREIGSVRKPEFALAQCSGRNHGAGHERRKRRRSFATAELSDEMAQAIGSSRMTRKAKLTSRA